MSKVKQLIILLDSLEKKEFDKIVKIYLQNEYNYKSIIFTDGKDDTGIDIKVFDFDGQKIQFQLTTQKSGTRTDFNSFNAKLVKDLEKAKINHENYGYRDKLIFFYSKVLTNAKIREYEKLAFKNYGINLELIEANRIAEEAENIFEIQLELYKISELDKFNINNSQFDNQLLYDLLSFGKPTEFKIQVIDSFILQQFYLHKKLTKREIITSCEEKFNVKENETFYDRLLSKFQTERKIIKNKNEGDFSLTDSEEFNLQKKNEQFQIDKNIFINGIQGILKSFNQEAHIDDFIQELTKLYVENFSTDLNEIISNESEFQISSFFMSFSKFVEQKPKGTLPLVV